MPDTFALFFDTLSSPFHSRRANLFFQILFGSLAQLLLVLMPRSLPA
ncbi:hypothetical protein [Aureimonas sp. ME7]|nr:hypothetical protein [Aureimonas sp. ME7]